MSYSECKMFFRGPPHLCMQMGTYTYPSLPVQHPAGDTGLHVDTLPLLL